MKSKVLAAGVSAALLLCGSPSLFGHGGQYRGPSDTVPPNLGGGGDTTPPGNPGGPGTPGPGAPTTGGGRAGPGTGGGPVAPGAGAGASGRPTTGGRGFTKRGGGEGFERWEFWWEHNKEPFLNLKSRLDQRAVVSDSAGFHLGRGRKEEAVATNRPSAAEVKQIILPALEKLLLETNADIVDSAVLAIGRTVRKDDAEAALPSIRKTLSHAQKTARESATLAMGVLGSQDAYEDLAGILNDTQDGRRATNHSNGVEDLVRAFAAASMGLTGDVRAVDDLKAIINDDRLRSKNDLKAMSILALGLMPKEVHEDLVPYLLGLMESKSLNRVVRAQAPVSLGRLHTQTEGGSPRAQESLTKVVGLFDNDKTDNDLRRSLALCIGMLASLDHPEALDALFHAVERSNDDQTRHFSIMALAQIGGRDESPDAHAEMHTRLENFFLKELSKPKRITHQPYGALGLAVYARNENLQGAKARAGEKIRESFGDTNNPSYQGAMAIALGLLDYKIAQDDLWEKFDDSNDQPLKGYIAISLGLMRANSKAELMRHLIQRKGLDSKFRLQLARSLGLMGDHLAVTTLINYLQNAETLAESSSSAQALGLIGDKSAVDPLLGIATNAQKQALQRGFAAVALGIIAEKDDLPWNTVFAVNSNYRAKVPALSEILDIL